MDLGEEVCFVQINVSSFVAAAHSCATYSPPQPVMDEFGGEAQEGEELVELLDHQEHHEHAPVQRQRITTRYMTKYEKARVLGTRALQIR